MINSDDLGWWSRIETRPPATNPRRSNKRRHRLNPLFTNPLSTLSVSISERFPPELYDRVIAFCHISTLRSCALVCKDWLSSSRFQLFTNAGVVRVNRKNATEFFELVDGRNPILSYIRRIEIEQGGSHRLPSAFGEDGDYEIFQFDNVLSRFTGLDSVTSLTLGWIHMDVGSQSTKALQHNFPRITELVIDAAAFDSLTELLEIVAAFPMLKHLRFSHVHVEYSQPLPAGPPEGLQALGIEWSHLQPEFFQWMISSPRIPQLSFLALGEIKEESRVQISHLLRGVESTLEHLELHQTSELAARKHCLNYRFILLMQCTRSCGSASKHPATDTPHQGYKPCCWLPWQTEPGLGDRIG